MGPSGGIATAKTSRAAVPLGAFYPLLRINSLRSSSLVVRTQAGVSYHGYRSQRHQVVLLQCGWSSTKAWYVWMWWRKKNSQGPFLSFPCTRGSVARAQWVRRLKEATLHAVTSSSCLISSFHLSSPTTLPPRSPPGPVPQAAWIKLLRIRVLIEEKWGQVPKREKGEGGEGQLYGHRCCRS